MYITICLILFVLQCADWYRKKHCKRALKAAMAYFDAVYEEKIKTSITSVSVTAELFISGYIEADVALITRIVSCCPTQATLYIKNWANYDGSAELKLSISIVQLFSIQTTNNFFK